jgi:hypothetical protein
MNINNLITKVVDGEEVSSVINSMFEVNDSNDVDEARFTPGGITTSREGNNAILSMSITTVKNLISNLSKLSNVGLSSRYGGPESEAILKEAKMFDNSLKKLKNKLPKFLKKLEAAKQ